MLEQYDFSPLSVMVIDESEHMTRVLKTVLTSMRISTLRTCNDGRRGLHELAAWVPDVLFVDFTPGQSLNALRLVRLVRRHRHPARHCPIVLVTSDASDRTVRRARDAGVDYTLAKPFSVKAIYRVLVALRNGEREFVKLGTYYGPDRRRKQRLFEGDDRRGHGEAA